MEDVINGRFNKNIFIFPEGSALSGEKSAGTLALSLIGKEKVKVR